MGGLLTHLLLGIIISVLALVYYNEKIKSIKHFLVLFGIALWFSVVPDIFTGIYIFMGIEFDQIYHVLWLITHPIIFGISLTSIYFLKEHIDVKNEILWVVAFSSLVIHFIIDLTIAEPFWWL